MNLNRILINESEKKRILEMHSKHKSLITESATDFPVCTRYAGKEVSIDEVAKSMGIQFTDIQSMLIRKGFPLTAFPKSWIKVDWNGNVLLWGPKTFKYFIQLSGKGQTADIKVSPYHCKCTNGKLKATLITKPKEDETKCEEQKNSGNDGQKDTNCKNKNPYNAFTDAGLNWKEESKKWFDAKCNGTTPCILGNAQTNINLRNAFCDGTWGSKKGQDDGNQPSGDCIEKCGKQPKVIPPGSIITMQLGYFYDSIKGKCVEVGGQTGPFGSIAECEACKCNGKSSIVDGKLPDTTKLLECVTKHLKITQLPISCTSAASNVMPTNPTQCFNDLLKGIDQNIVKDFILCLFGDSQIPDIIKQLPLPGINIPIGNLPGLKELPIFIAPVIEKPNKPLD